MPSSPPVLSVSIIARNEASRLPAFLDGIAELDAEIVLLDTGSEDDTAEIARSGGCTVHHFTWCDDFAAARNEALRHCTGTWVLSLDADERIAREDHGDLLALTAGPQDRAYRFTTRNYANDHTVSGFVEAHGDGHAAGFRGWFPSEKVRLFPNVGGIGFEGAVHELIGPSIRLKGLAIQDSDIPIHHYPLLHRTETERRAKQLFYLELGKKKIAANPEDPKAQHELGDQLIELGELADALRAYREAVRLDPNNALWLKGLGSALLLAGQVAPAIQALRISARLDSGSAECWRNLGVAHARAGEWTSAREAFQQALDQDRAHGETMRYLALARHSCGDDDGAITLLEPFLEAHPQHGEGRALYRSIMALRGRAEAAEDFLARLKS